MTDLRSLVGLNMSYIAECECEPMYMIECFMSTAQSRFKYIQLLLYLAIQSFQKLFRKRMPILKLCLWDAYSNRSSI